jgi:hypothetical protein
LRDFLRIQLGYLGVGAAIIPAATLLALTGKPLFSWQGAAASILAFACAAIAWHYIVGPERVHTRAAHSKAYLWTNLDVTDEVTRASIADSTKLLVISINPSMAQEGSSTTITYSSPSSKNAVRLDESGAAVFSKFADVT